MILGHIILLLTAAASRIVWVVIKLQDDDHNWKWAALQIGIVFGAFVLFGVFARIWPHEYDSNLERFVRL